MIDFKRIIFLLSFLSINFLLFSQQLPEVEELLLTLNKKDVSRIERSNTLMQDAEKLVGEARDIYIESDESTHSQALKKLFASSSKQENAVYFMYDVYNSHIKEINDGMKAAYRDDMKRGIYYRDRALGYIKKAKKLREDLEDEEEFKIYYVKLLQTYEFERLCIINIARSLRIYQDWPVEYDYNWDTFVREIDPLLAEDRRRDSIADLQKIKTGSKDSTVIFRVQIAAHTIEMPTEYLRSVIYFGDREISKIYNDGWYKYDIGTFYTYAEAKAVIKACGVEKAFVAAYANDKRIPIQNAIARVNGKK